MGNVWSHWHQDNTDRELTIRVTTGDRKGAGTDANVWIIIHDENGQKTDTIKLGHTLKNDNERGAVCTNTACSGNGFGLPYKIELWRDSFGLADSWFPEKIEVEDHVHNTTHIFPAHRWIRPRLHYMIREYDCCLPQFDEHRDQRENELKEYRRIYQYTMNIEDGPAQIKTLPEDEKFTGDYKWCFVKNKASLMLDTKKIKWTTDKWKYSELCELKSVYKFNLTEPGCLEHWNEDRWFGMQRVQGVNPVLITLCKKIPDNFGVEAEMVEPFLEEMTLKKALSLKRIFICDLAILKDIVCKDNRVLCNPLALFFLNKHNELMPIAIQLFQEKGPDNPVFLPNDEPFTWLLAKMYYNNADANYHQSCTHLGLTHLLMEGIVICTHRNLSPSHPMFKLMAPHFLFLIAINSRGLDKLICPNGWVDKTLTVGRAGMFELFKRGINNWRMDVHGNIPNEIKSRGVLSKKVLPHYPYRDDAITLYKTIEKYVGKIVNHFYDTEEKVRDDFELQRWRAELVKDKKLEGCGLKGVAGETNDRFTSAKEVVEVITVIINTCSVAHAAANFQQYEEYAFPPNYPAILYGEVLNNKNPLTAQDILEKIPNKETTLNIMLITQLLSTKATQSLGDFESQYMFDPFSSQAAQEFREDLEEISKRIKERNKNQGLPYHWLDPEFIPNAISI